MNGLTLGNVTEMNARKYSNDNCLVSLTGGTRDEITFREFDNRVNQIGRALADRGLSKGTASRSTCRTTPKRSRRTTQQ